MPHPRDRAPLVTTFRLFVRLLFESQRVEWQHSLVLILVITGLFSTPLALGSIRHRVYAAVKAQIEKENNARELRLEQRSEGGPPTDAERVREISARWPELEVVGNHKLVVSVAGPEGRDLLTLQTLAPNDPRSAALGLEPPLRQGLGMNDVVVSDGLGQILYGAEWPRLWNARTGQFRGAPLRLEINDLPLEPSFRVVARRTLPGRAIYGNLELGAELRRYTRGFGSRSLALPSEEALVAASLPNSVASRCVLLWDETAADCGESAKAKFTSRLRALHFEVTPSPFNDFLPRQSPMAIGLREPAIESTARSKGQTAAARFVERYGDCREILSPQLPRGCASATIFPEVELRTALTRSGGSGPEVRLLGLPADHFEALPEAPSLRDTRGSAAPSEVLDLMVPEDAGHEVGTRLSLNVASTAVPAQVRSLYRCAGAQCPWFLEPLSVERLLSLSRGALRLHTTEPLRFAANFSGDEYDEILVYAPEVEAVEPLREELARHYPAYAVDYNVAAIEKLRRQDSRLATLFSLTLGLSALFLLLALGALAQINLERRHRQVAQMLILGLSRPFVRRLVVAEYLLLTLAASVSSAVLTTLLCSAARKLLLSRDAVGANADFALLLDSMRIDPRAFLLVAGLVATCTWVIALFSARRAALADPVTLLD